MKKFLYLGLSLMATSFAHAGGYPGCVDSLMQYGLDLRYQSREIAEGYCNNHKEDDLRCALTFYSFPETGIYKFDLALGLCQNQERAKLDCAIEVAKVVGTGNAADFLNHALGLCRNQSSKAISCALDRTGSRTSIDALYSAVRSCSH